MGSIGNQKLGMGKDGGIFDQWELANGNRYWSYGNECNDFATVNLGRISRLTAATGRRRMPAVVSQVFSLALFLLNNLSA